MLLAVLFSGGKDSAFALWKAQQENEVVCLVSVFSANPDSFMFHTPNINLVDLQAEALGLPLIRQKTLGEKEKELEDLKNALAQAKEKFKIEGVVSGAVASTYQASRIQKICQELNLEVFNPLWQMDQETLMREIIKTGFKFVITKIAAYGLDKSWLGKVITTEDIDALVELNKKIGLNIAFEGGEAETLAVDGPNFKSRIELKEAEVIMENEYTGLYQITKAELKKKTL